MFIALVVLLAIFGGSLAQVMSNQSCITQPCTLGTSYVDIALVIDSSRSIDRGYFDAIKQFINLWASDYSIGPDPLQVQFGFVTYGLWGASYGTFSTASMNYPNLTSVVDDLAYQGYGDRNMFDALTKVANNLIASDANSGWRNSSKHLMVVFSGDSFTGPDTWKDVATRLRGQFDRVVAIGLTQNAVLNQYAQLVELVGGDASNVFLIGGASGLKYIIPWLEYQACDVSSSGQSPTPPQPSTTTSSGIWTSGYSSPGSTAQITGFTGTWGYSSSATNVMTSGATGTSGTSGTSGPSTATGNTETAGFTAATDYSSLMTSEAASTAPTTAAQQFHTCQDYYNIGQNTSGVYSININGTAINVYCDMDSTGGWTVIQSRVDGSVDFNVSYDAYRYVLGEARNPFTDFWLGNENIHMLSQMYSLQLRVKLWDCDHGNTMSRYMHFSIDGSDNRYALHTDFITDDSDGGDAFNTNRFDFTDQGRPFSTSATYTTSGGNTGGPAASKCKALLYGGWWFGSCTDNLNGKWYDVKPPLCLDNYPDGIRWTRGGNYSLPQTLMEVLPNGVRLY